jgi:hypothetical protein
LLEIYLDLPRNELQAMPPSKRRFTIDRLASVAAMQEWTRNSEAKLSRQGIRSNFSRRKAAGRPLSFAMNLPSKPRRGAMTGFNRLARCSMITVLGD